MAEKKVQCPHCNEIFKVALPIVPAEQLTRADIEEILKQVQSPGNLDHRHKTADEFLDCPECRSWFDKTGTKYLIAAKELAASDKEPELTAPAIGSIFKKGE